MAPTRLIAYLISVNNETISMQIQKNIFIIAIELSR